MMLGVVAADRVEVGYQRPAERERPIRAASLDAEWLRFAFSQTTLNSSRLRELARRRPERLHLPHGGPDAVVRNCQSVPILRLFVQPQGGCDRIGNRERCGETGRLDTHQQYHSIDAMFARSGDHEIGIGVARPGNFRPDAAIARN